MKICKVCLQSDILCGACNRRLEKWEIKQIEVDLSRAPVLGINKLYSAGESYRVRVEKRYVRNVQPLTGVVGKIIGKNISFVFE